MDWFMYKFMYIMGFYNQRTLHLYINHGNKQTLVYIFIANISMVITQAINFSFRYRIWWLFCDAFLFANF